MELSVFAIFYGLDWVATVPPTVKLAAENFGREKAGIVFGWVFAGHQLGAATAAFGAGYFKSDFDTYMPALQIAGLHVHPRGPRCHAVKKAGLRNTHAPGCMRQTQGPHRDGVRAVPFQDRRIAECLMFS